MDSKAKQPEHYRLNIIIHSDGKKVELTDTNVRRLYNFSFCQEAFTNTPNLTWHWVVFTGGLCTKTGDIHRNWGHLQRLEEIHKHCGYLWMHPISPDTDRNQLRLGGVFECLFLQHDTYPKPCVQIMQIACCILMGRRLQHCLQMIPVTFQNGGRHECSPLSPKTGGVCDTLWSHTDNAAVLHTQQENNRQEILLGRVWNTMLWVWNGHII